MSTGSITTIVRGDNYYINNKKLKVQSYMKNTTTDVNYPNGIERLQMEKQLPPLGMFILILVLEL